MDADGKLHTGQPWERNWVIAATDMAKANGTTFVRLGSFDGLDKYGNVIPETTEERQRRLALAPRRRRITKADRLAVQRRAQTREE